jgi:hypothetical protein
VPPLPRLPVAVLWPLWFGVRPERAKRLEDTVNFAFALILMSTIKNLKSI